LRPGINAHFRPAPYPHSPSAGFLGETAFAVPRTASKLAPLISKRLCGGPVQCASFFKAIHQEGARAPGDLQAQAAFENLAARQDSAFTTSVSPTAPRPLVMRLTASRKMARVQRSPPGDRRPRSLRGTASFPPMEGRRDSRCTERLDAIHGGKPDAAAGARHQRTSPP